MLKEDLEKEVYIVKAEIVKLSSQNIEIKDKLHDLQSDSNLLQELKGEINHLKNMIKHNSKRVLNIRVF